VTLLYGTLIVGAPLVGLNAYPVDVWEDAAQEAIDAGYGESTRQLGERLVPRPPGRPVPPAMLDG
jgi:hypothetical protein